MTFNQSYISDTLKQRLKYCIICKNKIHDIKYNALCKLDNSLPKFNEFCLKFDFDTDEYIRLRQESINDFKTKDDFSLSSEIYYNDTSDFKIEFPQINSFIYKGVDGNILFSLILVIAYIFLLIKVPFHNATFYICTACGILAILHVLLIKFIVKVKKIIVNDDFLFIYTFKEKKYHWNEILTIHSKTTKSFDDGFVSYKIGIIIDFIVGDSVEYEEVTFLTSPEKNERFLKCLEYFRNKHFSKMINK